MAKKIDFGNLDFGGKFKINKAQQSMLISVAITSLVLGVCVVAGIYLIKLVLFNRVVIREKNNALSSYSTSIQKIGVCKKPTNPAVGYSESDLANCNPNDINVVNLDEDTLRHKVLVDLAQNKELESVGRIGISACTDSATGEKLKYDDLYNRYLSALNQEEKDSAYELFAMCSALRAIPDALPAKENQVALMSSLDRIFRLSNWTPEEISPGEIKTIQTDDGALGTIGVKFEADADATKVVQILRNIEKSIREIDLEHAKAKFNGNALEFEVEGVAYYSGNSSLQEGSVTVRGDGSVTKTDSGSINIVESSSEDEEGI